MARARGVPPEADLALSNSQEDDDIMIVQEPAREAEPNEEIGQEEAAGEEAAGPWSSVRSRVAAAATAAATTVRRPLQYFIGGDGDGEGIADALQAPVSITVPKWALMSIAGLGLALLWQQERRIWVCLKMSEQHQTGLLKLVEMFVSSTSQAQAVAETVAATRARTAVEQSRESGALGAVIGMGAAALLLLSDARLKAEVRRLPGSLGGCPLYRWEWSADATQKFGLRGLSTGVLAQEVAMIRPEAVRIGSDGYMRVDYLGLLLS